jgi:hypothetical protein
MQVVLISRATSKGICMVWDVNTAVLLIAQ